VNTLTPKLILTPLLVGSASMASRRWGPMVSGWLVALPLTSGPIAFFIAIEAGSDVAQQTASGALVGAVAQVAFAAVYTVASPRGWVQSLLVAGIAFFVVGFAVPPLPPIVTYALLLLAVTLFMARGRRPSAATGTPRPQPAWDIPARMVIATVLVVAISSLAPVIVGRVSGILATFPVYAAVLATFADVTHGPTESADVLRGLAAGLLGFGAFFLALSWLLGNVGIVESFLVALAAGAAVQVATLPLLKSR
jgi:hypothetical protein